MVTVGQLWGSPIDGRGGAAVGQPHRWALWGSRIDGHCGAAVGQPHRWALWGSCRSLWVSMGLCGISMGRCGSLCVPMGRCGSLCVPMGRSGAALTQPRPIAPHCAVPPQLLRAQCAPLQLHALERRPATRVCHTCVIRVAYVWHTCVIRVSYVWHTYHTCVIHVISVSYVS